MSVLFLTDVNMFIEMTLFFSQHEDAYQAIINSVKGDASAKKLACQFIPRFFKDFSKLAEQAIDAQLDLCEDEDGVVILTSVLSCSSKKICHTSSMYSRTSLSQTRLSQTTRCLKQIPISPSCPIGLSIVTLSPDISNSRYVEQIFIPSTSLR